MKKAIYSPLLIILFIISCYVAPELPRKPITEEPEEPIPEITKYGALRLENNTTALILYLKVDETISIRPLGPGDFYTITLETGRHTIDGNAVCWGGAVCNYSIHTAIYLSEQGYTWSY